MALVYNSCCVEPEFSAVPCTDGSRAALLPQSRGALGAVRSSPSPTGGELLRRITFPNTEYLAAAYSIGAPGGAVLVILSWWLLTGTLDPSMGGQEWQDHLLVAVHILVTSAWTPLLIGIATLRLIARLGWDQG
jgi:hypothetical protein